jgi:hypothetical protein
MAVVPLPLLAALTVLPLLGVLRLDVLLHVLHLRVLLLVRAKGRASGGQTEASSSYTEGALL